MRSFERRIQVLENRSVQVNKLWIRIICEKGESLEDAADRLGIQLDEETNYLIREIGKPGA